MERRDNGPRRPSPEALLREVRQSEHEQGRLKIFLGAAPGVGKTFEMLTMAQTKKAEGIDVVVGVVETHGRQETLSLLQGLEIVPRRLISYKGHDLTEMDLDAVLARRPKLVLVDELAHTNAPESRHPKRYMDVEELLDTGIDVYTTLNIQHVESLNDIVAKITRIRVRETVPDSIIDRADDIEVIDLTPDDLITRLREGKVYVPEQASRAIEHYFSRGNLTALRELALHETAQRVDDQLVDYMRAHAIEGPWPAGERVLVLVDAAEHSANAVVRHAKRMADRLRAQWAAIHVETAAEVGASDAERDEVAQALRLAQRLGADAVSIPGRDVVETIVDYARAGNFTHIIVVKPEQAVWRLLLGGSVAQRLIRSATGASIHVIAPQQIDKATQEPSRSVDKHNSRHERKDFVAYAASLGFVAVAGLVAHIIKQALDVSNIALVFLIAVLASAVSYGLWASLVACFASVLAFNFFFLEPLYTFTIADPENVVALFFFAVAAVIASNLAARLRAQAIAARQRARITEELYLFSRKLTGVATLDDLLWATAHQIASMLKVHVVLLLPEEEQLVVKAGFPPEDMLDAADLAAARWCFDKNEATGRGANTLPGAKRHFMPLRTGRGSVGVVGIDRDASGPLLTPEQSPLFEALADQAALAIERINLAEDIDRARLDAEKDRLLAALLTSISHDLRTPLASIMGSVTSLLSHGSEFDANVRLTLLQTIREETERLNRFIANLLDMTRLESGPLEPQTGPADLSDMIGAALQRAAQILENHVVEIDLEADLPMLAIDMVLMEQVLINLLDNAAKYAPPRSRITIAAKRLDGRVRIDIRDEGQGIPETELERIFDKFYRVRRTDCRPAGTGLGLAICRGFVEAMKGTIRAANRRDRQGSVFTIELPAWNETVVGKAFP
jgi:two-component system sensor histidine kinase KdpD